jgi:hypothetical protein
MSNKALNSPDKLWHLWGPDRRRSGPHLFADSACKFSFVLPFWGGVLVRCVFTAMLEIDIPLNEFLSRAVSA